jgi:hypothetical protein
VSDAHAPLHVVSLAGRSYYDLLRERLGWKGRPEYRDGIATTKRPPRTRADEPREAPPPAAAIPTSPPAAPTASPRRRARRP